MRLSDAEMLRLAELLIKHARESTAIKDCDCAKCSGFMSDSADWLKARASAEMPAALPLDDPSQLHKKLGKLIEKGHGAHSGGQPHAVEPMHLVTDLRFRANLLRKHFKEVPPQILETMERAATALEKCSNHESPPQG